MEAVDSGPLSPELRLAFLCSQWGALPETGGVLDQENQLLMRMTKLKNVYYTVSRYRNSQGKQIHNLSIQDRQILRGLIDDGML